MPDPNTLAISTLPSQLAAQAVHERFANRPALFSVVFNALRNRILEHYPTLEMDLRLVKLASPHPSGGWAFQLLSNVATRHVLNPQLLDLSPQRELPFYLTQKIPSRLRTSTPPYTIDMQVIAKIIDALPSTIHIYFQQALADYWSEADAQGNSRWQWLGEFLHGQMTAAAASRSDLTQTQRDMLSHIASSPQRLKRLSGSTPATFVYFIETTLTRSGKEVPLLTPDLLLVRDKHVLLYSVAGGIEAFDSIDAFGEAWGMRMQRQFEFDSMTWRRNEPDADVFEQQAALILNQQLEDLGTLTFQGPSERALEQRLEQLTDPALLFTKFPAASPALLQKVNNQLPEWLKQADAGDRFAYHRHLQDMAQVLKQNQGRSYNEGIKDIHSFSREALRKQMQTDHGDHDPDDVGLDFSVAAGYPGGAGVIDHVRMSLTELAPKNLAGKPKGTLSLSSKSGQSLPQWLDEDYLVGRRGLIQRVDIGTTYPQKIKDLLLSDTADARQRETLFARELKVRLPMQALEYKIRHQNGVSAKGYHHVKALLGETVADRTVDGQEIVMRPLALCRKSGATPDTVNNIFIIEPRDTNVGPHLLYRPLYADCLYEFPTRQALLDAIAAPGDLQNSVLTWLTDKARPIFDHGGIKEPHIVRFTLGDEFGPYEKPAPATLAGDEGATEWLQSLVNGQLLHDLFGSTARALVDLADRESVSNSESRWAIVLEGAWLLFNTLVLPLVQGPAMLAGWLVVLVSSLEQDVTGLDSDDPTTRELALIDLLLNTAMVLLHVAAPSNRTRQPLHEQAPLDNVLQLASWRRPAGLPHPQNPPVIRHGPVALPGEPPATGHTALDFSRSIASAKAGAKLLDALLAVNVPWPDTLPPPETSGALKGLYRIGDLWHASVGGLLFQVSVVPGFAEVYLVDPKHPDHPGFKLASDGQGHWRLDRGAKLAGGMEKERFQAWHDKHVDRINALRAEIGRLISEVVPLSAATESAWMALDTAGTIMDEQHKNLRQLFVLRGNAIEALRETITARHEQQRSITARSKVQWDIAFDNFNRAFRAEWPLSRRLIDKQTELMEADRTNAVYRQHRDERVLLPFKYWEQIYLFLQDEGRYVSQSERGESSAELQAHANDQLNAGIATAYVEVINQTKTRYEIETRKTEPAQEIERILHGADHILRKKLLDSAPSAKYITAETVKQNELLLLIVLALDHACVSQEPSERYFVNQISNREVHQSIIGQMEMRSSSGYSTTEQMAVFKDALEHYERMQNAINSLTEMNSGWVRDEFRTPFLEHLREARTSLETQLADLILSDRGFAPTPAPDRPTHVKPATRKVIKTRNKGSRVGDLRPREPGDPGSFVDIKDPITGETVATYLEHASEGFWQEVVTARPPEPAPAPAVRSLKSIKTEAETVMGKRAEIERSIRFQQKKLQDPSRREGVDPRDWDVMLTQHAEKLEALADEIKGNHAADTNAAKLESTYRDEAKAVKQLAYQLCGEGYKLQRPQDSNVEYLWDHGFVDINLVRSRIPLKAGDYLTEYAVRDKNKIKEGKKGEENVLWYAHFHYKAAGSPKSPPEFAHLKTKEERKFTRKELIERARKDNRALVNMEKAEIELSLAEKLFLILEPLP
ncbi:hypothetical protein J2W17_001219 [Pseudomonas lini]|uniref:dermonecrotic toxin domain-containing protein n=1 Tax=Pseudomonas lini TaxID=163011 RepID=UPI00278533BA|nr:DUF6543 domain-containing protein [Pseudomonas lini]MDQ0122274.1 hypothetical protein [Pseudomonas lini]